MVLVMVLLLAKQIITLYHAVQKLLTKDQHALMSPVDEISKGEVDGDTENVSSLPSASVTCKVPTTVPDDALSDTVNA